MTRILSGKDVALQIDEETKKEISKLDIEPTLAIFKIGNKDSDSAYERGIDNKALKLGIKVIKYVFDEKIDKNVFYNEIKKANKDKNIHGILVFRPLPKDFDEEYVKNLIDIHKDIDASNDLSLANTFINKNDGFVPCTAKAVESLLDFYNIEISGKRVVVLGRSLVIGKPVAMLMLNKNATVTICHSKSENIKEICKEADILICAIGKMEMIDKSYVRSGQTIIDVGIHYNEEKGKLCGDCLFEDIENIVDNITPVPGGVGSITSSILLSNVVKASH